MICAKCDQAIRPGQQYEKRDIHSASASGTVVHFHVVCPERPRH